MVMNSPESVYAYRIMTALRNSPRRAWYLACKVYQVTPSPEFTEAYAVLVRGLRKETAWENSAFISSTINLNSLRRLTGTTAGLDKITVM